MRQELAARDFGSPESMENGGILDVFPVFHTEPVGQKIRCKADAELFRGSFEPIGKAACKCCAILLKHGIRYILQVILTGGR